MHPSTALATALVDVLVQQQVRHVVLSPGSRSSALVYALADAQRSGGLQVHVRVDERVAGFTALGLAKATGMPAVIVTTSGTAVGNLMPAVMEASSGNVPLIVLSADRPHELRQMGANQTGDQVKLFGSLMRRFGEIPAPIAASSGQVAPWRSAMTRTIAAALGRTHGLPGPAHLNVAFAEPLVPDGSSDWPEPLDGPPQTQVNLPSAFGTADSRSAVVYLPQGPRTVVVAGDDAGYGSYGGRDTSSGAAAVRLATAAGWPLFAEPSSGARVAGPNLIAPYRLMLDGELGGSIQRVVVYGRPTLSRPVSRLLARPDIELVVVSAGGDYPDVAGRALVVASSVALTPPFEPVAEQEWLQRWREAATDVSEALAAVWDGNRDSTQESEALPNGLQVAALIAGQLTGDQTLMVSASNAIRDLDLAAPGWDARVRVIANRGLAGIDGTISTAAGYALGANRAVIALLGDVAAVHDLGGWVSGPTERRPMIRAVVMDDSGGGIFEALEPGQLAGTSAQFAEDFERFFATDTGVDLVQALGGLGVYAREVQLEQLAALVARPVTEPEVLVVRTDRSQRRDLTLRLREAATQALKGR